MASKRQRAGGNWEYVVKRKELLPKPIHLTFENEEEGDTYCAHLEKLLDAGIVPEEFKTKTGKAITTIADAIYGYIDAVHITDDDVGILSHLNKTIGTKPLEKINYNWAEQWVKELQSTKSKTSTVAAPSTIRKKVGALARCFDWVIRKDDTMLVVNPLRMLPKRYATTKDGRKDSDRDRRILEGEEPRIWAILNKEKPEGRERALALPEAGALKLMFTIFLESGMRMRETYTLGKSQISLETDTIYLDKTKNGDKRQVPITTVLHAALTEYLAKHDDEKVFPFWDGSLESAHLKSTTTRLSQQWRRIFSAANCPGLHAHDLRHEATCRLYERTKLSDVEIAKILGWKSLKMALRYANLRASTLAKKMW